MLLNDIERYRNIEYAHKCFRSIGNAILSSGEHKLLYMCMGRCRKKNNGNDRKVNYSIDDNQFNFWSKLGNKEYSSNLYSGVGNRTTGKQLYKNRVAGERSRTNWDKSEGNENEIK